jgi:myo-inositol 2-dehydrogenase/D-chiro-inositol 1-dehydrogenase
MAASENPAAHTGIVVTAGGAQAPPLPHFFLERYLPSYELEWQSFVGSVQAGTPTATTTDDARAPLVIGLAAAKSLREHRPVAIDDVQRS